jgi:hypothetical protein
MIGLWTLLGVNGNMDHCKITCIVQWCPQVNICRVYINSTVKELFCGIQVPLRNGKVEGVEAKNLSGMKRCQSSSSVSLIQNLEP